MARKEGFQNVDTYEFIYRNRRLGFGSGMGGIYNGRTV